MSDMTPDVMTALNEIVGSFKGQTPLRAAWLVLPLRVQNMVKKEILSHLEVLVEATKQKSIPAPVPEDKPSRPRQQVKRRGYKRD